MHPFMFVYLSFDSAISIKFNGWHDHYKNYSFVEIIAKAVFWKVLSEFEGGCFITNIREVSENFGLLPLQQKLICDILMEENVNIRDVDDRVLMIKNSLCHKRVLLVLDDVNQYS